MDSRGIARPMKALTKRVCAHVAAGDQATTSIPGLEIHRFDGPTQPRSYLLEPSACLILQGRKRVLLGEREADYAAGQVFVTAIDLPLIAQVLDASPAAPYVGLVLRLDPAHVARLVLDGKLPLDEERAAGQVIERAALTQPLFGAVERLVDLALSEPRHVPVLGPLLEQEVLYRLLTSSCGPKIRQLASGKSRRIAQAVEWIKGNLALRLRVEDLAERVAMSASSLHHHFRSLTGTSPLQFQKRLRLNEARRLMLVERSDAATAALTVGYESPSQFSRDYRRLFGAPPLRDTRRLSEAGGA